MTRFCFLVTLCLACLYLTPHVQADTYPRKPVTMIVAYAPGGGADTGARLLAKYIQPYLGQRLIIQNKPGAGGQLGYSYLARSKPDGYKIGYVTLPSLVMLKMLRPKVPYAISDFEAIAAIQLDPVILAVNADSPIKTFADFVTAVRQTPGSLNVAGDGPQSNNQLQLVIMEAQLGIDVNFVAYNGSSPAITAVLGNQVIAAVPSASSAMSLIKNHRLRALTIFAKQRSAFLPDVPTIKEASNIDMPTIGAALRGITVPRAMAQDRKAALVDAFDRVMKDEQFIAHAQKTGLPMKYMDQSTFADYLKNTEASIQQYIHLLK